MLARLALRRSAAGLRPRASRGFCDGPTTFYSSQSGVTVDLPQGIHLHDVGLCGAALPQNEAETAAWENILSGYATSGAITSVEVPADLAASSSPAVLEGMLGGTAAALASSADGDAADGSGWSSATTLVAVTAAVGKVDGLDPDESIEAAITAVGEATDAGFRTRVLIAGAVGSTGGYTPDVYDVQSWVAELADAGCEAIVLGVEPDGDEDDVEEVVTLCKELDVLGVPMRYRCARARRILNPRKSTELSSD